MTTILYLTDLYYEAKGRKYYEEDIFVTSQLKEHFNILIGNPQQAISYLDIANFIVFRNTGSVIYYQDYFKRFLKEVKKRQLPTFNSFDGKADINGKQYLPDLFKAGYPVIPTVENREGLKSLGTPSAYIVKLKNGADSIGMELLTEEGMSEADLSGKLVQPLIDFEYEVSFYYLNDQFQYAMYAPDKARRWDLQEYQPQANDLNFANQFIAWNAMQRGIQRVDACRLKDGSLLLMELEDLNPYLSLSLLSTSKREQFMNDFIRALKGMKQ